MKSPGLNSETPSLSVHCINMNFSQTDKIISIATAFIYFFEGIFYLITNGHNITGVNPETKKRLSHHAGIPDRILTKARVQPTENKIGLINDPFYIDLYEDGDFSKPLWYIHPTYGYQVDVVAIPIIAETDLRADIKLFPINRLNLSNDIYPEVADDVFVLGFPFNIKDTLELPI